MTVQVRILIVDDEPHVVRSLSKLLSASRYAPAIMTAGSAGEALRMLSENETDILITDISMPGMTGLALAARAHEIRPACRTMILTAYDSFTFAREAIYANVCGYMLKTDGDESILAQCEREIETVLSRDASADEAQNAPGDKFSELLSYIDSHIGEDLTLTTLGERFDYNASYLSRLFIEKVGKNLSEYISQRKIDEIMRLMRDETLPLSEIAQRLGFLTRSYFNRFVKKHSGLTPMELRRLAQQQKKS